MTEPIPAATVVLLRERDDAVETLMLRKNSKLTFGGMWVFPGGRIDAQDGLGGSDIEAAARRAAVREASEEAGLTVVENSLAWISYWLPPAAAPKRFATWFFVAPAPDQSVSIDGGEIHDSAWMQPRAALARRDAREIELAPPTWMTLHYLSGFDDLESLMAHARERVPVHYETRMVWSDRGGVTVWEGDVAYHAGDLDEPGPRHRLLMLDEGWILERTIGGGEGSLG